MKSKKIILRKTKKHVCKRFLSTFIYSMVGFRNVFAETSFRYELLLVVLHVMAVLIIELTALEILLTTITLVMLLVTEMINTAIESVVDLVTSEKQPLAARAKDIGSAAVFSCIVLFIIAWVVVICGE